MRPRYRVALMQSRVRSQVGSSMGTAKSISGYDGRRSGQPTASMKKRCKEPSVAFFHEWPSALDITNELRRLQEAVNEYSLNQIWFSVHARVD